MVAINIFMSPLKKAIFAEIRLHHEKAAELDDEQLNKSIFHHPDSLRLSYSGFIIIKNIFTAYSFAIPESLKARHRFGLSRMEYPYFFTKRRLILFSEMDSMTIRLCGGIEGFLENTISWEEDSS